jgi:hypothetical protein
MGLVSDTLVTERRIAWELHVELATRIAVTPLTPGGGLLFEALASLAEMARRCREILRDHRPSADRTSINNEVETVAHQVLVDVVDPFLNRWEPSLFAWNATRPGDRGVFDHESRWEEAEDLRADLGRIATVLRPLTDRFAEIAEASSLLASESER